MKRSHILAPALLLATLPAAASDIAFFSSSITAASPTQQGRLNRGGTAQTWFGSEAFPGAVTLTTTYSYTTFTFAATNFTGAPYVEITFFDTQNGVGVFSSAYAGSYNPASLATNWLGDAGLSGNFNATDGRSYDVLLPANKNLVLVFNSTATTGLNDPFLIDVSAYADTSYDDPIAPTPEPSTFITLGTGLLGLAGLYRRRRAHHPFVQK